MPRDPPVTSATLPSKFAKGFYLALHTLRLSDTASSGKITLGLGLHDGAIMIRLNTIAIA